MMKVTPAIVQYEFIGLEAKVVKSTNPSALGISGKVIDETRNTFTILQNGQKKVIAKDTAVFNFVLSDGTVVEMDGKTLIGRPENRVKRPLRRLW